MTDSDLFYPFVKKKLAKIPITIKSEQGDVSTVTLEEFVGSTLIEALSNHNILTRKKVVAAYNRICFYNDHQVQKTKAGAGTRRAVKSTKAGRGLSRLPRAIISGRRSAVSNIPQAVKGRLAQRLIKNATRLRMNRRERQGARQAILYHLLRQAHLVSLPEAIEAGKTQTLMHYLEGIFPKKGPRPVLITKTFKGQRSTSHIPLILLDENHHSLYRLAGIYKRGVLVNKQGLQNLLLRVFTVRKL